MGSGVTEISLQAPSVTSNERAHLLAAAGLLHDVGKLGDAARRALPETIERQSGMLCPTGQGGYPTHRHVLHTARLLDEAKGNFGGLDRDQLYRIACNHHRPGDALEERILTHADRLASGHDRRAADEDEEHVAYGLVPLLAGIHPRHHEQGTKDISAVSSASTHIPTCPLRFKPDEFLPGREQGRNEYRRCCGELEDELKAAITIDFESPRACIDGLLGLTQRLLHAVPASRSIREQPDVTLFDHSHVVAALAGALAVQYEPMGTPPQRLQGQYRLVGIGLGRVQDFIFRPVSEPDAEAGITGEKGAARRLRARSFYLTLLSWLCARRLLDATGLPPTNLLVHAGDRGIVLLPDTQPVQEQVQAAMAYLEGWIHQQLGASVRLDLAISDPLNDDDFKEDRFAQTYHRFEQTLDRARLKVPSPLQDAPAHWGDSGWVGDEVSMPVDRPAFNEQIEQLGRRLPNIDYLSLKGTDYNSRNADISMLGYDIHLAEEPLNHGDGSLFALFPRESERTLPLMTTANHVPIAGLAEVEALASAGNMESVEPAHVNRLLTFEHLARLSADPDAGEDRFVGHPMLGVLKADVDRLGLIMAYGLGEERVSFSRFASLSRTLDLFFKGFLTDRLRVEFPRTYTVFSGGDDLFLIGPWYDQVRLLEQLRNWFARLTCDNAQLTFSAGLIFAPAVTPVSHVAEHAEAALERSKDQGRDRITIGSVTISWADYAQALDLHRRMRALSDPRLHGEPLLNRSAIHRLLMYGQMGRQVQRANAAPVNLKWRAQLNYDLRRNMPDPEKPGMGPLHETLMALHTPNHAKVLYIAALLTLYCLRGDTA